MQSILKLKKYSNSGQSKWFESSLVLQTVQFGHLSSRVFHDFTKLQFKIKKENLGEYDFHCQFSDSEKKQLTVKNITDSEKYQLTVKNIS